uniref:EGF-like domain-containing protein n=1 Tax=Strongyloides venezuelensis TaxID=75913 RepID=A0A0K0EXM2_STRVS
MIVDLLAKCTVPFHVLKRNIVGMDHSIVKDCIICVCPPYFQGLKCTSYFDSRRNYGQKHIYYANKDVQSINSAILNGKCAFSIISQSHRNLRMEILNINYRLDRGTTGLTICKNAKNLSIPSLSSEVQYKLQISALPGPRNLVTF